MRRSLVTAGLVAAASFVPALTPTAEAQAPLSNFSVSRFTPAPGPNNYLGVDGATVLGELAGSAGLTLDFAYLPLQLYSATCTDPMAMTGCSIQPGTSPTPVVEYSFLTHLWGTIALFDRVQIGLVLPLGGLSGAPFNSGVRGSELPGNGGFSLGDPRLHVKVNLLGDHGDGFRLALVAFGTAPLSQAIGAVRYLGDQDPSFGGHLVAEYVTSGLHVAANVGGLWRDGDALYSTEAVGGMTYAAAVGYEVTPLVQLFGEVAGVTSFRPAVDENPLEARLGGLIRVDDFLVSVGAGAGLIAGAGTPVFRGLAGFAWAPTRFDEDRDGLDDSVDACPTDAEDVDDFDDADGCPDPDNDADGIPDFNDTCPGVAEDMDGVDDTDGCPDEDTDGDGIQDGYDSCVNEAEDMDGDRDDDGCPDLDRDRDNINDAQDACPEEPEDTDGYGDEDGCPETDFDSDNLADDSDACPDQAEDLDGFEDEDGCPEEGAPPPEPATPGRRRGR